MLKTKRDDAEDPTMNNFYTIDNRYVYIFYLSQVAPPGMNQVQTMSCGACSIEHGQKAMFIAYRVCMYIELSYVPSSFFKYTFRMTIQIIVF